MSIDALLLHLEEDADREAARLRAEADARAAAHEARAEADAAKSAYGSRQDAGGGAVAPLPLAATGACGLLATAWLLTRRQPRFAPAIVREEALLIVAGLGMILAIGPNIAAGWRSALALRAEPLVETAAPSAVWVFIVVGACLSAGGIFALWRRGR